LQIALQQSLPDWQVSFVCWQNEAAWHVPLAAQKPEQQLPPPAQASPTPLQLFVRALHVPEAQWPLQQFALPAHAWPIWVQAGTAHDPLRHVPLQQSPGCEHPPPTSRQATPESGGKNGDPLDPPAPDEPAPDEAPDEPPVTDPDDAPPEEPIPPEPAPLDAVAAPSSPDELPDEAPPDDAPPPLEAPDEPTSVVASGPPTPEFVEVLPPHATETRLASAATAVSLVRRPVKRIATPPCGSAA
jgi:hypothetical protein